MSKYDYTRIGAEGGGDIKIQMLASENRNEKEKGNLFILLKRKESQCVLKTLRKTIPEGTTVIRVLQGRRDQLNFEHNKQKWGFIAVSYQLALATGTCHLPLQGVSHVLLRLLVFNFP